jgi:hypothetical protein
LSHYPENWKKYPRILSVLTNEETFLNSCFLIHPILVQLLVSYCYYTQYTHYPQETNKKEELPDFHISMSNTLYNPKKVKEANVLEKVSSCIVFYVKIYCFIKNFIYALPKSEKGTI